MTVKLRAVLDDDQRVTRGGRAGQSSMRRFRLERRQTLRDHWHEPALLLATVLGLALWVALDGDELRRTLAAVLLGMASAMLVVGWLLGFDARSLRWRWGAAGEQWTAEELARLGRGWHVFHDVADGRGNWDHVVVGAPGVFVIDSKNLREPAVVDAVGLRAGRLRIDGSRTRGSAVRLKEALEAQGGPSVWVQGVVAVWGDLRDVVERDRILYAPGPELVDALMQRRRRLTSLEIDQVACSIEAIAAKAAR